MVLGEGHSELYGLELYVEAGDDLHFRVNQVLACFHNIQSSADPDDSWGASQGKCPPEASGDTLSAVVVEDLQVHPATGEAEHNQNPSLELLSVLIGKYGSKDISLTIGEGRLDGFEDIRDISLECREGFLVELDAPRARFFQVGDHFPDTWYEELCLYV